MVLFQVFLPGRCSSGKNAIQITRSGHRYPSKKFVEWRDGATAHVLKAKNQIRAVFPFAVPIKGTFSYFPIDRRRRDVPGMLDAIEHLLERCGIVKDDVLIEDVDFRTYRNYQDYEGAAPGVMIVLETK